MKIRTYTWGAGIDNLISFKNHSTDTTYYAVKDHLNSVIAFVDESGNIAERYEYDAYGNTQVFNAEGAEIGRSAIGNRYAFQGREIDWETGLYYFRARWYDPDTGRWCSKDPLGIAGGLNLYEAFGNNAVNFIDPFGLESSLFEWENPDYPPQLDGSDIPPESPDLRNDLNIILGALNDLGGMFNVGPSIPGVPGAGLAELMDEAFDREQEQNETEFPFGRPNTERNGGTSTFQ